MDLCRFQRLIVRRWLRHVMHADQSAFVDFSTGIKGGGLLWLEAIATAVVRGRAVCGVDRVISRERSAI